MIARLAVFASAVVVTSGGCIADLSPAGSDVVRRRAEAVGACRFVGDVVRRESGGFALSHKRLGAVHRVRNEVARLGGDSWVEVSSGLDADPDRHGSPAWSGMAPYRVEARGYRCLPPADPAPPS